MDEKILKNFPQPASQGISMFVRLVRLGRPQKIRSDVGQSSDNRIVRCYPAIPVKLLGIVWSGGEEGASQVGESVIIEKQIFIGDVRRMMLEGRYCYGKKETDLRTARGE